MKCLSLLIFSSISVDSSNISVDDRQRALFDVYESHNTGPSTVSVGRQRLHAARMATDSCWATAATC